MSVPQPWTPESVATPEDMVAALHATDEGGADLVQLLTPEGERVPDERFDSYAADVGVAELQGLYRDMVLVRRFDREANALQRQGQLGIWVPLLGQEAAQIGAGRALAPQDMAFPSYREHGVAWCRGIDPTELLGIFRGTDQGGWDPKATRFHLYTIVIGNQCLNATGYAMGQKFESKVGDGPDAEATMCFFGDGATSQGDVHEGFVWAAVYDAPVVFYCQNNQWAISEPTERQTRVPLYKRAQGYGFPGIRVDGNDVLACLAVSRWALEECRTGNGPVLDRGVHLPDGRAHHLRRSHPLPPGRRAGAVEAQGPDRTGAGAPRAVARGGAGVLRRASRPRPTRSPSGSASSASTCPRPRPSGCSPRSTRRSRRWWPPSARRSWPTTPRSRGR